MNVFHQPTTVLRMFIFPGRGQWGSHTKYFKVKCNIFHTTFNKHSWKILQIPDRNSFNDEKNNEDGAFITKTQINFITFKCFGFNL